MRRSPSCDLHLGIAARAPSVATETMISSKEHSRPLTTMEVSCFALETVALAKRKVLPVASTKFCCRYEMAKAKSGRPCLANRPSCPTKPAVASLDAGTLECHQTLWHQSQSLVDSEVSIHVESHRPSVIALSHHSSQELPTFFQINPATELQLLLEESPVSLNFWFSSQQGVIHVKGDQTH